MFDQLQNLTVNRRRYRKHSKAVIMACFYNPQKSPYRLLAFQKWYQSIRHLPHEIVECLIGKESQSQLPQSPWIHQVRTPNLLWHKETLLNTIIASLPDYYEYVFWLDTDVVFTNLDWVCESVEVLQESTILQPFKYCIHLDRHQVTPHFDIHAEYPRAHIASRRHPRMWRSFASNVGGVYNRAKNENYDVHGHVGFAWGARREVLEQTPLFDQALIGGADHIIAHAAAGHIPHPCITKAFEDVNGDIEAWSRQFYAVTEGKVGYVRGDLYHLWHGDIRKREYLPRIQAFAKQRLHLYRGDNGLWLNNDGDEFMEAYYEQREAGPVEDYEGYDTGFADVMGYSLSSVIPFVEGQSAQSILISPPVEEASTSDLQNEPITVETTTFS